MSIDGVLALSTVFTEPSVWWLSCGGVAPKPEPWITIWAFVCVEIPVTDVMTGAGGGGQRMQTNDTSAHHVVPVPLKSNKNQGA
jgi:hypothetical protein